MDPKRKRSLTTVCNKTFGSLRISRKTHELGGRLVAYSSRKVQIMESQCCMWGSATYPQIWRHTDTRRQSPVEECMGFGGWCIWMGQWRRTCVPYFLSLKNQSSTAGARATRCVDTAKQEECVGWKPPNNREEGRKKIHSERHIDPLPLIWWGRGVSMMTSSRMIHDAWTCSSCLNPDWWAPN